LRIADFGLQIAGLGFAAVALIRTRNSKSVARPGGIAAAAGRAMQKIQHTTTRKRHDAHSH
jgi:hypothetical protein